MALTVTGGSKGRCVRTIPFGRIIWIDLYGTRSFDCWKTRRSSKWRSIDAGRWIGTLIRPANETKNYVENKHGWERTWSAWSLPCATAHADGRGAQRSTGCRVGTTISGDGSGGRSKAPAAWPRS